MVVVPAKKSGTRSPSERLASVRRGQVLMATVVIFESFSWWLLLTKSLKLSVILPVSPEVVFRAWLDSEGHSAMTGSAAVVNPEIRGEFSAWDGYISGRTIEVESPHRIVQEWRTTDFPEGSGDSVVELRFEGVERGTRLVLIHTQIPEGQAENYEEGWKEFYFTPMERFFKSMKKV